MNTQYSWDSSSGSISWGSAVALPFRLESESTYRLSFCLSCLVDLFSWLFVSAAYRLWSYRLWTSLGMKYLFYWAGISSLRLIRSALGFRSPVRVSRLWVLATITLPKFMFFVLEKYWRNNFFIVMLLSYWPFPSTIKWFLATQIAVVASFRLSLLTPLRRFSFWLSLMLEKRGTNSENGSFVWFYLFINDSLYMTLLLFLLDYFLRIGEFLL